MKENNGSEASGTPASRKELEKTLQGLKRSQFLIPLIMFIVGLPFSVGIFGGLMWGVIALFCLIVPMWWLATIMGICGGIIGVVLIFFLCKECRKSIQEEIQKTQEKLAAMDKE